MQKEIKVADLQKFNPFTKIEKEWVLITAGNMERCNTMTANWLGFGYLWRKNVAFVFVRPQRYTFEFTETSDHMTLSFFNESYRKVLQYCGTISGRKEDKIAKSGLTKVQLGDAVGFEEASITLVCKKLYADYIKVEDFIDKDTLDQCYPEFDFHKMYIVEIEKAYINE